MVFCAYRVDALRWFIYLWFCISRLVVVVSSCLERFRIFSDAERRGWFLT